MFLYPQKIFSQAKLVKNRFKDHTNPNKGTFSIRYNEKADFTISVINSVGIEVFRAHIKPNTEISMPEHIASGIYYVKVESNNTLPVIKKISIIK